MFTITFPDGRKMRFRIPTTATDRIIGRVYNGSAWSNEAVVVMLDYPSSS